MPFKMQTVASYIHAWTQTKELIFVLYRDKLLLVATLRKPFQTTHTHLHLHNNNNNANVFVQTENKGTLNAADSTHCAFLPITSQS